MKRGERRRTNRPIDDRIDDTERRMGDERMKVGRGGEGTGRRRGGKDKKKHERGGPFDLSAFLGGAGRSRQGSNSRSRSRWWWW